MPAVAAALRSCVDRIIERWKDAVKQHLPDADPLTATQVRNSIPAVLEKVALALESDQPEAVVVLAEVGTAHGVVRFQEEYDINELLVEYRLLRRIVLDELHAATGGRLTFAEGLAVDMGIDTALQRGVASYVEQLAEQLKSAAAAESKYLSFLSHDLRNNLNAVTLTLQLLSMRLAAAPDFADAARDVRNLQRAVFETVDGMDRLLQAERLRKQKVALKLGPVDLRELADSVIGQARSKAEAKGLAVENAVPADARAHSDRELLTLVLQNLLGNAVKFSPRGRVRVRAEPDPGGWRVAVADDGPGIAADRVGQLFEAFSRGETHGQSGMGLGLTIASHAARLLGSELRVESEVGRGAEFSLVLAPAAPTPEEEA